MTTPVVDEAAIDDGEAVPSVRRRRRTWMRLLAVIVVIAVVVGGAWLVWGSSVLSVRQVRVVGIEGAAARQVLSTAAIPIGVPLARLDTEAARARVSALPWVAEAEVRRGWPSEAVVAVSVRTPVARLASGGLAVDADGVTFEPQRDGGLARLPRVDASGDALAAAVAVLAELPDAVARRVVSVSASTRDDVALTLKSGDIVRWGSAEDGARKGEVLTALMNRKADVYDVTAPESPTTFRGR